MLTFTGYIFPDNDSIYCDDCFIATNRLYRLEFKIFHGFIEGQFEPIACDRCKKDLAKFQLIPHYTQCFILYTARISSLRARGYPSHKILLVNCRVTRDLIRLIVRDTDTPIPKNAEHLSQLTLD